MIHLALGVIIVVFFTVPKLFRFILHLHHVKLFPSVNCSLQNEQHFDTNTHTEAHSSYKKHEKLVGSV